MGGCWEQYTHRGRRPAARTRLAPGLAKTKQKKVTKMVIKCPESRKSSGPAASESSDHIRGSSSQLVAEAGALGRFSSQPLGMRFR